MSEIKLYDFQQEVIDCKENMVLNWSRGLGSTFVIISKILNEKPKNVIYIGNGKVISDKFKEIMDSNDEIKKQITKLNISINEIFIMYNNGNSTKIRCNMNPKNDVIREIKCDLYVVDKTKMQYKDSVEYIKDKYTSTQKIFITCENNYNKHLQREFNQYSILEYDYIVGLKYKLIPQKMIDDYKKDSLEKYYEDFAILDEPLVTISKHDEYYTKRLNNFKSARIIDVNDDFLIKQMIELEYELNNIIPEKDNVLTRKNLLDMILSIHKELKQDSVTTKNNIPCYRENDKAVNYPIRIKSGDKEIFVSPDGHEIV